MKGDAISLSGGIPLGAVPRRWGIMQRAYGLQGVSMLARLQSAVTTNQCILRKATDHLRLVHHAETARQASACATVQYFAYGANMSTSTLQRRGIVPTSAEPASVPGATIAFRHAGAYATLILHPRSRAAQPTALEQGAHGVLYRLSMVDFQKLVSFETGYSARSITIQTCAGRHATARVFVSDSLVLLSKSLPPKEAYLALMRAGAVEHGLCSEHCAWLASLPTVPGTRLPPEYFETPADSLARAAAAAAIIAAMIAAMLNTS